MPDHNADVHAQVDGVIEKIAVKEGDHVNKGDLLVQMADRDYRVELSKLEAQIAEKRARLRLLDLPEEVQKWAATGLISAVNIEAIYRLDSKAEQIKAAKAIVKAKQQRGKTGFLDLDPRYKRTFRPRKSKQQIANMIAHLYSAGLNGLATRLLAWVAGHVTDEEIREEIEEEKQRSRCSDA